VQTIPSARKIRNELLEFAISDTRKGVQLFIIDLTTYCVAIATVLFAPWMLLKLIAGVLAGAKVANLATLGHDAAHNSLTASRTLNKAIGIVSFTPGLFNFRLWLYDHHNLHHHKTNENHPDSFTPMSKQEFAVLSRWKKLKHRFYRLPSLWVFGIYYIVERWWKAKFFPRAHMPVGVKKEGWPHTVYLITYFFGFITLLYLAPHYSNTSSISAIFFGFIVPFYIFQSLYSFTVYVQHTHPRVAWFKTRPDRNGIGRQDVISVQLRFPDWLSHLVHHVYDHTAHHVYPAIPCYRLAEAQAKLNLLLGSASISEKFSFTMLRKIQERCKLYDFEGHRWLDFEGKPTSRATLITESDFARPVWNRQLVAN
jgi:acyl-lipid omega-6 desaturase (Delta-12 desaturase)